MLSELKTIKESLAAKPAAPPPAAPKPEGIVEEFKAFLSKYGIVGLAIAFIIGGAAGKLVSALVADIIMPVITFFIPGGSWEEAVWAIGPIVLAVGHFVGSLIDFLVIAFVVFWLMKVLEKTPLK
ncbi:MscL family protein [Candidatus Bathyarchaeota archaeon]|nr:MscL family protein [Candidatus Bathyarchaeota archaeon]